MDYKIDGERLVLFLQEEISTKNAKKVEDEHVQIDPETKAFHLEETRKYLFPRMDWAMEQVHKIEEVF